MLCCAIQLNPHLKYPVPRIDFAALKKANNLEPAKGKLRYLSTEEEQRFLYELNPDNFKQKHQIKGFIRAEQVRLARQDAYDLAVTLLDLGCRYSEATHLRIDSIDLKTRTVELYRSKVSTRAECT